MSRVKNTERNIIGGFVQMIISTTLSFVSRKIFIASLGANYLGLSGLFTNVLSVLSLAELGIGDAIVFSLYKPIAEQNEDKIHALMNLYKKVYRIIGLCIMLLGIILLPFLKHLVNFEEDVNINYYYIYLLFLANSVISYWFFAYRSSIINAAQKNYKIVKINLISSTLSTVFQIAVLLMLEGNIAYYVYLLVPIVIGIIKNILVYEKSNELFPFLKHKSEAKLDKSEINTIKKNVYALAVTKISSTVYSSSDNLVISALIGTYYVGLYSNYSMIIITVTSIVNIVFNNLRNSVGDLNATESSEYKYEICKKILLVNMWIYGFCSVALFQLLNPFIALIFGNEYVLPMSVTTVIALLYLIPGLNHTMTVYKDSCGLFWQTRYRTLATAVVNVTVSILLAKIIKNPEYKLLGVFMGTIIAYLITIMPVDPRIVYRDVFRKKARYFYFWYAKSVILTGVAMSITWLASSLFDTYTWIGFLVQCLIVLVVPNSIFLVANYKTPEFEYYYLWVKNKYNILKNGTR